MLLKSIETQKMNETLPKVRYVKNQTDSVKSRNLTIRDDYKESSPVMSKKKRNSNSSLN
jgi:hypothetical protein